MNRRKARQDLAAGILALVACVPLFLTACGGGGAGTDSRISQLLETTQRRADALLAKPELSVYRGWIKFLRFQAEREIAGVNATNSRSCTNVARFADWVRRIERNPNVLEKLRGVQEWAYESAADDSGQPFKLNIPTDYNPSRPAGMLVTLHYPTQDHRSTWMQPHRGMFELAVMGRARRAGYEGLAGADVLDAIEYVEKHWRIDTNRVHLTGVSMGAMGIVSLAGDHPHLFASGQINCGLVVSRPVNNLLTFPIYAVHSEDDPAAPIITSRGPLTQLLEMGGQVVFDATNGFGHAPHPDGCKRAGAWRERQVRPDSRTVRQLDFTALSGTAARAWWAEVLEWGPAPRPARFVLTAGTNNTLEARLSNITRLRLWIGDSPFDPKQTLRVTIRGAVPFEIPAPLPESLVLASGQQGWQTETNTELPPFRLHTPGGPLLLYDGSPLLIVYGTCGNTNLCKATQLSAQAASTSPNPIWGGLPGGPPAPDGVPPGQNVFGQLKVKADRDVTDADMQRCHLVLIGTEEQNSLVARLAPQLPVRWTSGGIRCSDGLDLDGTNRVLDLVHYNPLVPQRLIQWVASDVTDGYASHTNVVFHTGADLVIKDGSGRVCVVARSFDSRWHWDPARANSPLIPAHLVREHDWNVAFARALQRGTGADFVFAEASTNTSRLCLPETMRVADVEALVYHQPVYLIDLKGTALLQAEHQQNTNSSELAGVRLYPDFGREKIQPDRKYRVAVIALASAARMFKIDTQSFRIAGLDTTDILDRFLPLNGNEADSKSGFE